MVTVEFFTREVAGGSFAAGSSEATKVSCPDCGMAVRLRRLNGKHNPDHVCDARCTNARGSNCECSCAGANHGAAWST